MPKIDKNPDWHDIVIFNPVLNNIQNLKNQHHGKFIVRYCSDSGNSLGNWILWLPFRRHHSRSACDCNYCIFAKSDQTSLSYLCVGQLSKPSGLFFCCRSLHHCRRIRLVDFLFYHGYRFGNFPNHILWFFIFPET